MAPTKMVTGEYMNKPLLWLMLVCILSVVVILGLVAGAFTESIQRALTLPQAQAMGMNSMAPVKTVVPTVPTPSGATTTPTTGTMNGTGNSAGNGTGNGMGTGTATILAQDTFQRTDQSLWGAASDGRNWAGDANTLAAFSVTGMMGQIANGNGGLNAIIGSASSDAEVLVQGTINHYNGASINLGVVVRWSDTNNWYKLLIDANTLSIIKRVNGVSSTLAAIPFHAQDNMTYTLRFRAIGAMLSGKAWASNTTEPTNWMLLTNDTTLTTGQAGIRVLVQPTTVVRIAMFQATTATMM